MGSLYLLMKGCFPDTCGSWIILYRLVIRIYAPLKPSAQKCLEIILCFTYLFSFQFHHWLGYTRLVETPMYVQHTHTFTHISLIFLGLTWCGTDCPHSTYYFIGKWQLMESDHS